MSTEQSVDPELVEQTKQQIRNLVREIAQLSKSELSPVEFYDALLNRIVSALAAIGGAIWTIGESGGLELEYQINLRETRLAESEERQAQHGRLLRKAISSSDGLLAAPHSGAGDEEEGGNPTDYLLVLAPLKTDQQVKGVIEVFQRPDSQPTVQRGYLRFLVQMCELAGDYLKTRQLRHFTDRQTLWTQLENFTRVAHASLDPRLTAYTIANDGRRLIECDRVSVGIVKGKKCVIEAVSGQDTFDKRSNTVSMLARLATAVTATGETIWYTGDTTYMAPQVEDAVQEYIDEAHSKAVGVIPLKRPKDDPEDKEPPEVIGALIIEQIEDSRPKEGLLQRVEIVTEHSQIALANALEHQNLFLMPVWRAIGKAQWVLRARTLPKTISIAVAVLILLLILTFWPAAFNLEGKGALQPVLRRDVFAQVDGEVTDVLVEHGQKVAEGQILTELENKELEGKISETKGQLLATGETLSAAIRSLNNESKLQEQDRLRGDIGAQRATQQALRAQLDLLKEKQAQLKVRSPINGEVTTWHVRDQLFRRPVQRGQVLLNVADPAGEWELEIRMAENRMGFITDAQNEFGKDLVVEYILATDPGQKHYGKVKEIQKIAEVHGEEGNTVLIRVAMDKEDVKQFLRQGSDVTAKVNCGTASIGYVWLHDVISFVQSKILFKL